MIPRLLSSRDRRSSVSGGESARLTNASQRERNHSEAPRGPDCRTPCRAPRCCRSMRESRGPIRPLGSIRPLSSFGAHVSTITSWRQRTLRYSRSVACRRTPVIAGERTTLRTGSTPSSMVGGCPSDRQVTRWARSQTVSDTPLRRVEFYWAGTARASLSSGPCLLPTWNRSTRVSNSRADTSTSLVRLRPPLSPAGPGFGLRRRAPFSRNSSVRLRRCGRRSATHGSLPRMKQRSGPSPDLLRRHGCCQAAMRSISHGEPIGESSCQRPSGSRSYGRHAYGPARCWWEEKSSECGGDRRPTYHSTPGAAFPRRNVRRLRPRRSHCRCRASTVRLPSAGADSRRSGPPRIPLVSKGIDHHGR